MPTRIVADSAGRNAWIHSGQHTTWFGTNLPGGHGPTKNDDDVMELGCIRMPPSSSAASPSVPFSWRFYFPDDDAITKEDPRHTAEFFELTRFFRTTGKHFLSNVDFSITMCAVFSFPELRDAIGIPDFAWGVCERPIETLSCIGVSVFEALFFGRKPGDPSDYVDVPGAPINIRLLVTNQ